MLARDPLVYLPPPPTDEERERIDAVGLSSVHCVPPHMFMRVVDRVDHSMTWSDRFDTLWFRGKRLFMLLVTGTGLSLGGAYKSCVSSHDEKIIATARAEAAEQRLSDYRASVIRDFDWLKGEITQLRAALLRLGITTPDPSSSPPGSDLPDPFNKYSLTIPESKDLCSMFEP